ncbi:MAG: hypothetical protein QME88_03095 [Actinomycetota bacterium]|nr:hypothetical protein [Actinomycetota bacterium]
MERGSAGRFAFTGRWRGRRTWVLATAAFLALALTLAIMWYLPEGGGSEDRRAGAAERGGKAGEPGGSAVTDEELPEAGQERGRDGGQEAPETGADAGPAPEANVPGLVVEFPDPAGGGGEAKPPGGYGDITGDWVLDMSGSAYGINNCHIRLEENGKIATPPEYEQVFIIKESEYVWDRGTGSFAAGMLVMVRSGPSQAAVPAEIYLVGQVGEGLSEVTGDFVAEPQGETYSPYAQRGTFRMHR